LLTNQANHVTVKNTIFKQGYYNPDWATSAGIVAGAYNGGNASVGTAGNNPASDLTVHGNLFQGVKQGVYVANSGSNFSSNIQVYNNDFGTEAGVDKITHSVYLRGVQGFEVYNNIIYDLDITFTGGEDFSGIYVGGNSTDGKIYKNQILGID